MLITWLQQNAWLFWGLVAIVALLVEVSTTALVSIWFVPAAIVTAVVSAFCHSFMVQCLVFVALSAVCLFLFRGIYRRCVREKQPEMARHPMVDKTGTVTEAVSAAGGQVMVGDVYWKAVSADDSVLAVGQMVKVTAADGTTLTVIPCIPVHTN